MNSMAEIEVLYLDAHLAVIDKPSGILMHRSKIAADKITLVELLQAQLGKKIYCPHRLDRQTSGVCVIAFNALTTSLLQKSFARRQVQKTYIALTRGLFPDTLIVDRPLTDDNGLLKEASTYFKCLQRFARSSLVEAAPTTGRQHQIRRHLAHNAHHIIGDTKYGKGGINRDFRQDHCLHRLFLHAHTLTFEHPCTGVEIRATLPLPTELQVVLNTL
jgi:tRNA pseudouridine65 synthase